MGILLEGKKCLITGASRGIGRAMALTYASEGAILFLCGRSVEALKQVSEECKKAGAPRIEVFPADLANSEEVETLCQKLIAQEDGVDVLVNSAGLMWRAGPLEGEPEDWKAMWMVNVHAPQHLTRRLCEKMKDRKSGVIINVASWAGTVGKKTSCVYSTTKWAMRGWSFSCHEALREYNIKCTCLNPDYTNTDMVAGNSEIDYSRVIQPSDVAEASLLPIRQSAGCVPLEITMKVCRSAGGPT